MKARPDHVEFIIGVSYVAKQDTIYKIEFRAWQLEALRDYIIQLERKELHHERG